jgi:hypothetical protein
LRPGEAFITIGGAFAQACFADGFAFRCPTAGTSYLARSAESRGFIQLPHQFPDAHAGAELNLRCPNLQIAIVALPGISLEGSGFVAYLRGFIDAGTLSDFHSVAALSAIACSGSVSSKER